MAYLRIAISELANRGRQACQSRPSIWQFLPFELPAFFFTFFASTPPFSPFSPETPCSKGFDPREVLAQHLPNTSRLSVKVLPKVVDYFMRCKGGLREVFDKHLPCLKVPVHRGLRPLTGGGEVFFIKHK